MGGSSSSTQTQQSTTAPWQAAQPMLQGILGQLGGMIPNSGVTGGENSALNTIESNAGNVGQYAPAINNYTSSLLAGGGALSQAPMVQAAYNQYGANTSPLANNTNYNPYATPGFSDAINTLTSDITNSVNGQFAAAGRDGSPANTQALARGITQGISPIIQSQYNQNVQNQQNAAGNLYNAQNTTGGLLSGLQQQYLANQGAGVGAVSSGLDAQNAGANAQLQAELQRQGIPIQNLGLLANIGVPIAGLGSQSSGTGTTQNQMSGAQQFGLIAQGIGGLFGQGKAFPSIL